MSPPSKLLFGDKFGAVDAKLEAFTTSLFSSSENIRGDSSSTLEIFETTNVKNGCLRSYKNIVVNNIFQYNIIRYNAHLFKNCVVHETRS